MPSMPGSQRDPTAGERDPAEVQQFAERFASMLIGMGLSRMPARVYAAILMEDEPRLTAAELSERLKASPAAISGAVRLLVDLRMMRREREPGSRRDHYVVRPAYWYEMSVERTDLLAVWTESLRDGVDVLGRNTPAGDRLAEGLDFYEFLASEIPGLLVRWREHRKRSGLPLSE